MRIVALLVLLVAGGCTTFTNARPLAPGQHAVAVTGGGALASVPGIGPIPIPNVTVEGRSGIIERLDINYGVHVLPALFGVAGAHVGGSYQFFNQPNVIVPALTVGQRVFGFTNILDGRKAEKNFWAMSQTDLVVSWEPLANQLLYAGGTLYIPLGVATDVALAPVVGVRLSPGWDWLQLNVEGRWLAPSVNQSAAVVDWIGVNDNGAFAITAGLSVVFTEWFKD
jgi:hypothetical protein